MLESPFTYQKSCRTDQLRYILEVGPFTYNARQPAIARSLEMVSLPICNWFIQQPYPYQSFPGFGGGGGLAEAVH